MILRDGPVDLKCENSGTKRKNNNILTTLVSVPWQGFFSKYLWALDPGGQNPIHYKYCC